MIGQSATSMQLPCEGALYTDRASTSDWGEGGGGGEGEAKEPEQPSRLPRAHKTSWDLCETGDTGSK